MDFIRRTIDLAMSNVEQGGRPFACVIAKHGQILAEAANQVAQTHDPTAHAEIVAIREASAKLESENFAGCDFYILAHPCPMCLAAMYYLQPGPGCVHHITRGLFTLLHRRPQVLHAGQLLWRNRQALAGGADCPWFSSRIPMESRSTSVGRSAMDSPARADDAASGRGA